LSISSYSFWADEAWQVFPAIGFGFDEMMDAALELAQPGYCIFVRVWAGFVGTSELAIRCGNLLFVPIALLYCLRILKAKNLSALYSLLFFMHPLYVYYMNEAKPYIIFYTLGFMFVYYVFCSERFYSIGNILKINIIYLLGVFVGLVFGFIYVAYLVRVVYELANKRSALKNHLLMLLLFSMAYIPLLNLYVSHFYTKNSGGSAVASITLIAYCYLGFFGLGLSRRDLRVANFGQISSVQILLCALLLLALLLLVAFFILYRVNPVANEMLLCVALAAYLGVLIMVSHIADYRAWERHAMPGLPLFLLIVASGFDALRKKTWAIPQPADGESPPKGALVGTKGLQAVSLMVAAMLFLSSANLRYNPYYQHADSRGALAYVRELQNDASSDRVIFTRFDDWTYAYYNTSTEWIDVAGALAKNKVYHVPATDTATYGQIIDDKPPDTEYVFVFNNYFLGNAFLAYFDEQGFAKNTDYHLVGIYVVE
jgi:hypothetical protein